jgi:hypothetical protein
VRAPGAAGDAGGAAAVGRGSSLAVFPEAVEKWFLAKRRGSKRGQVGLELPPSGGQRGVSLSVAQAWSALVGRAAVPAQCGARDDAVLSQDAQMKTGILGLNFGKLAVFYPRFIPYSL